MSGEAARRHSSARTPRQRGDEAELFERHWDRLVRIVQHTMRVPRHIAEDACAIAWLQLLRTQPEREAIFAWLRVVATREAVRLIKAQGRHTLFFEEDPAEPEPAHADRGADLQLALEARQALEHIAALTPRQVRIFGLHVAGLSYDEICEATGYSWTQVNRHIGRARSALRSRRAP